MLDASSYAVILAEPGGGKTELMGSLARQLGVTAVTASKFGYVGARSTGGPLVIDAFDELAKVDSSGIYKLLTEAEAAKPTHVYLSSRSSEWSQAATNAFKDFLGNSPLVVRLREFDEIEQSSMFENHLPGEDFAAFQTEVARFGLEALLPNPQFLTLFADAYIESGRNFTDKHSIFAQAVERLAKDTSTNITRTSPILSAPQKIELASEVFAKLLLSGAEGVATSEAMEDRMYPLLATLFDAGKGAEVILATRLFKPTDSEDQHAAVHKIVAEYCAAGYLTKRISDPADPLTLSKCLPIIAPNSVVRDELRGLLGWMASLGDKTIEQATIDLDPYAVLANGDPSQLAPSSKRLLLDKLKDVENTDPYFRRGDFWRRFSVAGFFTREVVDEIRSLLARTADGHLRDLMLELLAGSPAIPDLADVVRQLVLSPNESENTRFLASKCLLDLEGHDHRADLAILFFEASQTSLKVAAKTIEHLGSKTFSIKHLSSFFRACAHLYPRRQDGRERTMGGRYFIKRLISTLDLETIQGLLNEITPTIFCKCGHKAYRCDCRNGISKISGIMLDRYFQMALPPYDPECLWKWLENLNFRDSNSSEQSKAVQALRDDDRIRQGIIAHVFEKLTDRDQIFETKLHKFEFNSHSGLHFQPDDYKFVVDLAFDANNPTLWACFIANHDFGPSKNRKGSHALRRHMREQAAKNPEFMRQWKKYGRTAARYEKETKTLNAKHVRRMKRYEVHQDIVNDANIKYVNDNRKVIESGQHWSCLVRFAQLTLLSPEKIVREFGNEKLVRTALRNSLDFIADSIPDLEELAGLQCASKFLQSEMILYAACMEIMRENGALESVDLRLLRALRTNIDMHYDAVSDDDRGAMRAEVDRILFPGIESAESYLRHYLEPQLMRSGCTNTKVWALRSDVAFESLRGTLSLEWLRRFRGTSLDAIDTLFEIAAEFGDRKELNSIIADRCAEFMFFWPDPTGNEDIEQKRCFWFLRAFYFLDDELRFCWEWIKADRETVLLLHERSSSIHRSEYPTWPKLTSIKVEAILDAFIACWPKVELADHWGTDSPKEENAYRFLTGIIWTIDSDDPDLAIPVLDRLLKDDRFADLRSELRSIRAGQLRKRALRDFSPPAPREIVARLDQDSVVTVEGLRQRVVQELEDFQKAINGGEFNSADRFYEKRVRLGEVRSTEIIAERLNLRLEPQGISITPEHQLKGAARCDFTVTKLLGGKRRLLVTEVKGQWHKELYSAASAQLHERYAIHPDAEQQGIYLVIWFGPREKVAGLKSHTIKNAKELRDSVEATLPARLRGFVDVFVLDVSRHSLE